MLPTMLEEDRRRAGWSTGQMAWRLGITVREYREIETGERWPDGDVGSDLQAAWLAAVVRDGSVAAVAQWIVRVLPSDGGARGPISGHPG